MEVEDILKEKRKQANQSISEGIEKVIILKTFKSGETVWEKGEVLWPPLSPDIIREIRLGMETVEAVYKR
jgi:hypothetical protein